MNGQIACLGRALAGGCKGSLFRRGTGPGYFCGLCRRIFSERDVERVEAARAKRAVPKLQATHIQDDLFNLAPPEASKHRDNG